MSNDAPDKVSQPGVGLLEKAAQVHIGLLLLSFMLATDIAIGMKFHHNIMSFEWKWGDGHVSFGFVTFGIAIYSVFMSITAPILRAFAMWLFYMLPFYFYGRTENHNPLRYVLSWHLRDEALREQNEFMLGIFEKEIDKNKNTAESIETLAKLSFACLLLMLIDRLITPASIMEFILSYPSSFGHLSEITLTFAIWLSIISIALPIYISLTGNHFNDWIDYPPLARKIHERREEEKGHFSLHTSGVPARRKDHGNEV